MRRAVGSRGHAGRCVSCGFRSPGCRRCGPRAGRRAGSASADTRPPTGPPGTSRWRTRPGRAAWTWARSRRTLHPVAQPPPDPRPRVDVDGCRDDFLPHRRARVQKSGRARRGRSRRRKGARTPSRLDCAAGPWEPPYVNDRSPVRRPPQPPRRRNRRTRARVPAVRGCMVFARMVGARRNCHGHREPSAVSGWHRECPPECMLVGACDFAGRFGRCSARCASSPNRRSQQRDPHGWLNGQTNRSPLPHTDLQRTGSQPWTSR